MDVPIGDGTSPIYSLRARAVCIDMEEGVLNRLMRSPMGELFDNAQFVKDVSGAGNNWAHGHGHYGPLYADEILEAVRVAAEKCDSLQSFFIMHSLGGGTGSGLGTYVLHLLADAYPDVYRFNTAVFPAGGGSTDVVTAPYNSVLALNQFRLFSDAVLPVDNEALVDIVNRMYKHNHSPIGAASAALSPAQQQQLAAGVGRVLDAAAMPDLGVPAGADPAAAGNSATSAAAAAAAAEKAQRGKAFEDMNGIAAHLLTSLTASMRFPGALNIDLNEITMNLVPFPRMHFLVSSLAPLHAGRNAQPRSLDQVRHVVISLSTHKKSNVYSFSLTHSNRFYFLRAFLDVFRHSVAALAADLALALLRGVVDLPGAGFLRARALDPRLGYGAQRRARQGHRIDGALERRRVQDRALRRPARGRAALRARAR